MAAFGWTRSEVRGGGALAFALIALAFALAAGLAAVSLVRAARRTLPVVVARRLVSPLSPIVAADVALRAVPVSALPPGALRAEAAAVGAFTRMGLVPGEVVTAAALSGGVSGASAFDMRLARLAGTGSCPRTATAGTDPPPAVPAGTSAPAAARSPRCRDLVAMSLPLNADQGYQLVRAGDQVDVAATYTAQSGTVSQVVAADVPVLSRVDGASGGGSGLIGPGGAAGATSGWLVLGLSPVVALRLELAVNSGHIDVFLRPPGAPSEPAALQREVVTTAGLAGSVAGDPPAVAGQLP